MTPQTLSDFIRENGYDFAPEQLDVRWRIARCQKTNKKLWYIGQETDSGFLKFSFGECGDKLKKFSWNNRGDALTPKEKKEFATHIKKVEKAKEKHQIELALNIEAICEAWKKDCDGSEYSAYLLDKGFGRELPEGVFARNDDHAKNILVVPLKDASGQLWSVQQIFKGGAKKYWAGARKKDTFFTFGGEKGCLYIGEGFATCMAVWKKTGNTTICAFDTGNLEYAIKSHLSVGDEIVLLADWDGETFKKTGKNPGMLAAQHLTEKYQIGFAQPQLLGRVDKNVDFADLWRDGGLDIHVQRPDALRGEMFENPEVVAERAKSREKVRENAAKRDKSEEKFEETTEKTEESFTASSSSEEPVEEKASPSSTSPPQRVDYTKLTVQLLPDKKVGPRGSLKVLSTIRNLDNIMSAIGAVIRYNVIKKDQEWSLIGEEATQDNYKNVLLARITDICCRLEMPIGQLDQYLVYLCEQNQYNPVLQWIDSVPWDGVSRLPEFYNTVTTSGDVSLKNLLIRKWMIAAVAAASRPNGVIGPGTLVFQGAQYIGKTRWFKSLVPEDLGVLADGRILDPTSKDSIKQLVSYWLVELGELDSTFSRADHGALKAFLTRDVDEFRPAYAKKECKFPRRTVFFGSVNKKEFLVDETGNRRFWSIECADVNPDHGLNMQQIWAEIAVAYRKGEQWWLNKSEMMLLNASNKAFETIDPIEELLLANFDWQGQTFNWFTASEIFKRIFPNNTPRPFELNKISNVVRRLNGGISKRTAKGRFLKFPISSSENGAGDRGIPF